MISFLEKGDVGRNKDQIWTVEEKAKKKRENDCSEHEVKNQREKLSALEGRTHVGTASEKWPHLKDIRVERMKREHGGETKKRKKHRK